MRVLFVYLDTSSSEPIRIAPGITFLSGYLKRNNVETDLCYYRSQEDEEYCLNLLRDKKTEIVAVSSVTSVFGNAKVLIQKIKKEFPEIFVVCGGAHVSLFPEALTSTPGIDAICVGYGEEALLELVRSIEDNKLDYKIRNIYFKVSNSIIKNELRPFPENLDKYFPEDRSIFYKEFKRKRFFNSDYEEFIFCRGCPYNCSFCSNHGLKLLGSGKYINYPKVETCINSIQQAMKLRSFRIVNLHDDILMLNKTWFRQFVEQYKKNIGLPFVCNARVGTISEADIKMLKDANCERIIIGIESGNEYIRNNILNKKIGANSEIIGVFKLAHKYGIATSSQNMIGFPQENFLKFYDTVKINSQILPNSPSMSVYYPYPGTDLYKIAKEEGMLKDENHLNSPSIIERKESVLTIPGFAKKDIEFYANNFKQMLLCEYLFNHCLFGDYLRKIMYANYFLQKLIYGILRMMLVVRRKLFIR
ncbi:MAG: radical SAM protein [Elusimicrobia bacterium]|nr:radical SAM protein [Elusimicrobiota bacterium]